MVYVQKDVAGMKEIKGKADFHIHSSIGDAVCSPQEIVDYVEKNTDLDVIAITDHDQIKGGIIAKEYAEQKGYRINVIVGEEVSTLKGHLIGLFMKKRIKRYTNLIDTIKAIHEQDGICIIPHPLSWLTTSLGERAIRKILEHNSKDIYFDAIEMMGPSIAGKITEEKARKLNKEVWHLPEVAASDSHSLKGIGTCYTIFNGKTADDFRKSIKEGKTTYAGRHWSLGEHLEIFWEKFKKFKVF